MMRTALVSLRVFLERSWIQQSEGIEDVPIAVGEDLTDVPRVERQLSQLQTPASEELIEEIKELVGNVEGWGEWPSDAEVVEYCSHRSSKFQQFK